MKQFNLSPIITRTIMGLGGIYFLFYLYASNFVDGGGISTKELFSFSFAIIFGALFLLTLKANSRLVLISLGLILFSIFAYLSRDYFVVTPGSLYGGASVTDFLISFPLILGGTGIFMKSIWSVENAYKIKGAWVTHLMLGILAFLFTVLGSKEGIGYLGYLIYPVIWLIILVTLSKTTVRVRRIFPNSSLYITLLALTLPWLSLIILPFLYLKVYEGYF